MRKLISVFLLLCFTVTAFAQEALAPHEVYDYAPDLPYEEIERRYNELDLEIDIAFNDRVHAFINYFTVRDRDYTREMLRRKEVYFPIFEKYLAKYNLPQELKYLPIIEAGLNPKAVSGPQAVGLWQFMSPTAREQGLHIDWYIDERMDPEKSTEAACKYIAWLYGIFKDWKMTLAAYNSGIGNVWRAMRRAGHKEDFWEVYNYLPRETRSYVPQFAAILYAMEYADVHNIYPTEILYPIDYDVVKTNQFVYLKTLADEGRIDIEEIERLNPAIKKGAIPANLKNFELRIPRYQSRYFQTHKESILAKAEADKVEFEKIAKNMPGSTFGKEKVVYRVKSGDVLGTIARKHNVRLEDLKSWNNIRGSLIRVGQRLDIFIGPDFYDASSVTANQRDQPIPDSKLHVVQPGDTLWDISRMYKGLSIDRIKELNNLKGNSIKPGMKLRIG
ncbi:MULTISPECIES: lytic transglycosylase domain-containing protein [Roseivirga]|uniref:Lytic transglycosylase n=1 Tax=Roseivirga thermotolerans TaxID=1758176 RepID=A0ABQ3I6D2_9BACT|nr:MULTISPECIES: lytic transglycosylase domain-containing protein [Roseivirga]GHE58962.1 lytic transglycosylase [Roseivirga thermotolerans]|tara:strand:+ start:4883 stop:6220 length:1338 start_codon:yes stop_codon:yes gene_type:complete